jgi:predicted nuclease with TOPRIM domain
MKGDSMKYLEAQAELGRVLAKQKTITIPKLKKILHAVDRVNDLSSKYESIESEHEGLLNENRELRTELAALREVKGMDYDTSEANRLQNIITHLNTRVEDYWEKISEQQQELKSLRLYAHTSLSKMITN